MSFEVDCSFGLEDRGHFGNESTQCVMQIDPFVGLVREKIAEVLDCIYRNIR